MRLHPAFIPKTPGEQRIDHRLVSLRKVGNSEMLGLKPQHADLIERGDFLLDGCDKVDFQLNSPRWMQINEWPMFGRKHAVVTTQKIDSRCVGGRSGDLCRASSRIARLPPVHMLSGTALITVRIRWSART